MKKIECGSHPKDLYSISFHLALLIPHSLSCQQFPVVESRTSCCFCVMPLPSSAKGEENISDTLLIPFHWRNGVFRASKIFPMFP